MYLKLNRVVQDTKENCFPKLFIYFSSFELFLRKNFSDMYTSWLSVINMPLGQYSSQPGRMWFCWAYLYRENILWHLKYPIYQTQKTNKYQEIIKNIVFYQTVVSRSLYLIYFQTIAEFFAFELPELPLHPPSFLL